MYAPDNVFCGAYIFHLVQDVILVAVIWNLILLSVWARSVPLQQQRRVRVDDIEFNLTQHPLALFPHLEESLPPDVSCDTSHYFKPGVFPFL